MNQLGETYLVTNSELNKVAPSHWMVGRLLIGDVVVCINVKPYRYYILNIASNAVGGHKGSEFEGTGDFSHPLSTFNPKQLRTIITREHIYMTPNKPYFHWDKHFDQLIKDKREALRAAGLWTEADQESFWIWGDPPKQMTNNWEVKQHV